MLSIDAKGMNLSIQIQEKNDTVRIEFDHTLTDSEDAHQTLISMVRQARIN
jgi:putative heme iron utilization protein